ncbi:MAG: DUF4954 family protein [Rikenellaceae bacterium]
MTNPQNYRELTELEIVKLEGRGCVAEAWSRVKVSLDFEVEQLWAVRFEGDVVVGSRGQIFNSTVCNYRIGADARVESVMRLECREASSFGNGVEVATINENGGRGVKIYDTMRAQVAFVWATRRERGAFVKALDALVERYAQSRMSPMGYIGERSQLIGAKFVREVWVEADVRVEGATLLQNGTLRSGAYVGVGVKAKDFIAIEGSRIDTGATVERCLVGEGAIVANGFTAVDSLFWANSHLENGEAASIFAAPFTVSHHKSSLLIAGLFSFFNAGSGSNQSNHLFKCGAVHQAIHPRGCKFASGSYIMAPAAEGAFTMVKGYHAHHHDTQAFPFSYLIEADGKSVLMPGANLTSYGTERDIKKWQQRDKRSLKLDVVSLEESNPCITEMMIGAVNTIHTLQSENPTADVYMYNRVVLKPAHLKRGVGLYNKAIVAALGSILSQGEGEPFDGGEVTLGGWIDCAGQYITSAAVERFIVSIESGEISEVEDLHTLFVEFHNSYNRYAYSWALGLLGQLLGHEPTQEDIEGAIASGESSAAALGKMRESDRAKDCSLDMAVGYGLNATDDEVKERDFRAVRGL